MENSSAGLPAIPADRLEQLRRFYSLLDELERRLGGKRTLESCSARTPWPRRGVYFFFDPGESRTGSGSGPRVVRVGTHALTGGSGSTLWQRLSQHRGSVASRTGNHRGSIFRLLVGAALMRRAGAQGPDSWGVGMDPGRAALRLGSTREAVIASERMLEQEVSRYIGAMQVLWLEVADEPGPGSIRGLLERSCIALLSDWGKEPIDPPSANWLGRSSDRERVRRSGLWNNNHVEDSVEPKALDTFEALVLSI